MQWQEIARGQAGAVDRSQLSRAGCSSRRIDGLIARRELVEIMPSVYASLSAPASVGQREWAAVLWSGGVLSHRSAARRWRLPVADPKQVHIAVADRRYRHGNPMVAVHRVPLPSAEITRADGIALTGRSRTLVDLLRTEPMSAASTLLDRTLQQSWIEIGALSAAVVMGRGRTGNRQLRELISCIEPQAHAESERRSHAMLRRHRIRGWCPQYAVRLPRGTVFVDVAFPRQRLAVEVDGKLWHDEYWDRFEGDRERQNDLVGAGWRVLRFTWKKLVGEPVDVIQRIQQELAAPRV